MSSIIVYAPPEAAVALKAELEVQLHRFGMEIPPVVDATIDLIARRATQIR